MVSDLKWAILILNDQVVFQISDKYGERVACLDKNTASATLARKVHV